MKRIWLDEARAHLGEEVEVRGWVFNRRSSGKIVFLLFRDGVEEMQAVVEKSSVPESTFKEAKKLPLETSVILRGVIREEPRAINNLEMHVKEMEVVAKPTEEYPIQKKEHSVGFLMDHRHLWIRSRRQRAILSLRSKLEFFIHLFFHERGFVRFDAPILTPSACEGTTTLFEVKYFDEKSYLSQSGQLYGEAGAMALGKIYVFGPTFRAEKSKTRRHLTEFWMVEPEVAFYGIEETMELAEEFVSYLVKKLLDEGKRELEILGRDTTLLEKVEPPFPRISYDETVELLRKKGFEFQWGDDFGTPHEMAIVEEFTKPVFVHRFPAQSKAFYMKPDPEDPRLSLSVDLLAPEGYGEIIGGGVRIEDPLLLAQRIREHNLPEEHFRWYMDLRKFGSVPHAGFGLGIERFLAWIGKIEHVRETIPFPRTIYRLTP